MFEFVNFIRYLWFRLLLWWTRGDRPQKLSHHYDYNCSDPLRNGILISQEEIECEAPRGKHSHGSDSVEFFLQNSHGQILSAVIQRLPQDGYCAVNLYLRLKCGSAYCLNKLAVDCSYSDTFQAEGLKIEVVQPMRRWRIAYNGRLRQIGSDKYRHVRFIFIGNLITGCGDFPNFIDESFVAHQLARGSSLFWNTRTLHELNLYVQTFFMSGKVFVDSSSEEAYVWGYKRRQIKDEESNGMTSARLTLYTENGLGADVSEVNFSRGQRLLLGHLLYAALQERPIAHCDDDIFASLHKGFHLGAEKFKELDVKVLNELNDLQSLSWHSGKWFLKKTRFVELVYDGNRGHGVIYGSDNEIPGNTEAPPIPRYVRSPNATASPAGACSAAEILDFTDEFCDRVELTGGKGSSLAVLSKISKDTGGFKVPQGICVSTKAYENFLECSADARHSIEQLAAISATSPTQEHLKAACERTTSIVSRCTLPTRTAAVLREKLYSFVSSVAEGPIRFAIRSSSCGEDSEEMSAAGQMTTLLGVTIDDVPSAIVKCWASQFGFPAVEYRRRYGQPVADTAMSVIVQEMVPSEVSGVMFTVDPVNGDPSRITITANFGLGESVVSASAEPDTLVVNRLPDGTLTLGEVILGAKNHATFLKENGGTDEVEFATSRAAEQSLSSELALQLAAVGVLLQEEYAAPRDIEWAFYKNVLYMLQARPVTSVLDSPDIDFEMLHEQDSGLVAEYDCLSKANVGEVFGGSLSPITMDLFQNLRLKDKRTAKALGLELGRSPFSRDELMQNINGQSFFSTYSAFMDFTAEDLISKGFSIAMAGRHVDDPKAIKSNANKRKYLCEGSGQRGLARTLWAMWNAERYLIEGEKTVEAQRVLHEAMISSEDDGQLTAREMFLEALSKPERFGKVGEAHMCIIMYGSINNVIVLALLAHTEGDWTTAVFSDFASLVSSINNVLSAGVPQGLRNIAQQAKFDFAEEFVNWEPQLALKKLQQTPETIRSARMFHQFLQDHGHRSLHEFDLVTRTWNMDPLPLVKTIQLMVGSCIQDTGSATLQEKSVEEVMSEMKIKLNPIKRVILKFILARVRRGIALRERSKSGIVLCNHFMRHELRRVARRLVSDGVLPEEDLLFFLLPFEVLRLIDTRSPKLVMKATRRRKRALKVANDIYPEHCAGLPLVPVNKVMDPLVVSSDRAVCVKGTPVSHGRVCGPCRVVLSLDDANQIQAGDILITYATDIGWSPYFPMLAGIVTELGGLISHGAVVAREFGLPCIVGAHGASGLFVSGQQVLLDAEKGEICAVEDDH